MTQRLTPAERQSIRERASAATAGPWYAVLYADTWRLQSGPQYTDRGLDGHDDSEVDDGDCWPKNVDTEQGGRNMAFCASARTDIPRLLDDLDATDADRDRWRRLAEELADLAEIYIPRNATGGREIHAAIAAVRAAGGGA